MVSRSSRFCVTQHQNQHISGHKTHKIGNRLLGKKAPRTRQEWRIPANGREWIHRASEREDFTVIDTTVRRCCCWTSLALGSEQTIQFILSQINVLLLLCDHNRRSRHGHHRFNIACIAICHMQHANGKNSNHTTHEAQINIQNRNNSPESLSTSSSRNEARFTTTDLRGAVIGKSFAGAKTA